ncbi:MAG: hypothetical protein RL748_1211 [Pseudomonadota bacterium]|jgi:hypothetical protein
MKDSASFVEQRDFLLAAAAWQETLLQSYRSLHVTIQGFLIATSSAVLAVQLTGPIQDQSARPLAAVLFNVIFTAILAFLFWLQRKTAFELKGVVESRASDITHWHREIILVENELVSSQRAFTYFKMWQHAHRADVEHLLPGDLPEQGVSGEALDELIGKGLGHTRRVLDVNLFERIHVLSQGTLLASAAITSWFTVVWWRSLPA